MNTNIQDSGEDLSTPLSTSLSTGRHLAEPGFAEVSTGRKRVLITGSRDWRDEATIAGAILQLWVDLDRPPLTVVHGGARGADIMAGRVVNVNFAGANTNGMEDLFKVEVHPAHWDVHGRAAGHIRNAEMVALGADYCLAFIRNESRGATACLALAERAGIPTRVYRMDDGIVPKREGRS